MADLSEAIFAGVDAIRAADTGAGGLAQTGGTTIVNHMVQRDDPNYDETRAEYWPLVVVDVIEDADTVWGTTSAPDQDGFILRLTITTFRDAGRATQNLVSARLKLKLDGVTLANQTGWFFGPLSLNRVYQLRGRGNAYVMVHEYSGRAGDTAASLVGRQGSVTFTGNEGAAIGTTLFGQSIDEDISVDIADVRYWGDQADRLTRRGFSGNITAEFTVASMTPVIPVGTHGVLVVNEDTANTKKITYTNAVVARRRYSARTDGGPALVYLTFRVSSTGVPGTIPAIAT